MGLEVGMVMMIAVFQYMMYSVIVRGKGSLLFPSVRGNLTYTYTGSPIPDQVYEIL